MAKRLRAKVGLHYGADEASRRLLKTVGLSKMTPEQRAELNWKHVAPGEFCDDHPKGIQLDNNIARGKVEQVTVADAPKAPAKKTARRS